MYNLNLQTKLEYDFSNSSFSQDDRLRIIRNTEKQVKDIWFTDLTVTYKTDSNNSPWYAITFYLDGNMVSICYADKMIYISDYSVIRDFCTNDQKPFFTHPVYFLISWIANDGNEVKYNLSQAITLIVNLVKIIMA